MSLNFKEFFRPNKNKIILTIFLFLFLPFPYYVSSPICLAVIGIKCEPYWSIVFLGIGTIIDFFESFSFFSLIQYFKSFWLYYLFSIVFYYFISCLIVFLYFRFKNSKYKKRNENIK